MHRYSYAHVPDHVLLRDLTSGATGDCTRLADRLAQLGEVDARKLYLPAAYPSMFAYCVGELHLCEQAAYKRIQAARAARRFPAIFVAVAEDRLHLSGVILLAPHLTHENADALLAAATHRRRPRSSSCWPSVPRGRTSPTRFGPFRRHRPPRNYPRG